MTQTLTAYQSEQESLGFFRIFARPPGGFRREITVFRGAPVTPTAVSTTDPFTEQTAQLALPQVTVFDTLGSGDLDWLVPDCDIDIVWQNTGDYDFVWRWEGFIASYAFSLSGSESSITLDLKGALFALDNYLAIPRFPKRPIPHEILMAQAFDQDAHPARLGKFRIVFPSGWSLHVPEFKDPAYLAALKPWGVSTGQRWTGFTSRNTGSWEPLLSGHLQTLLTLMFDKGGSQWTVRNRGYRRPELYLRTVPDSSNDKIVQIVLGSPGVSFDGSRDFSQRADVIYGSGQDETAKTFANLEVSPDGATTRYLPFAYSARAYPRTKNPMYDKTLTPKETMIRFQDGVDEITAGTIAAAQYQRFAEPGITGSITLTADPRYADGSLCPRMLLKAGVTLRIVGLLGVVEGVLAHVTAVSTDFKAMTVSLTYDTKYRDALTVEEVRIRSRDALSPVRALQVGKYSNTIQDLALPWSYKAGSGMIPLASSNFFLKKVGTNDTFPYENLTTKYPPSNQAYKNWYIRVPPMSTSDSSKNWSGTAIPIRMGQQGTIRLTQVAAYDKSGHVLPVKFHMSIYRGHDVTVNDVPQFPSNPKGEPPPPATPNASTPPIKYLQPRNPHTGAVVPTTYDHNQGNPFYEGAWEEMQPNGFRWPWGSAANLTSQGAELVVGWGNYYEPAGYSPGRFSRGASRTGILEDSSEWNWDLSGVLNFDAPGNNALEPFSGMLFVMFFCDEAINEPVYFMGRLVRVDPGTS